MMLINRIKALPLRLKGTNIGDVLLGSSVNTLAKFAGTGLGFVGSLLIARYHGAEILGEIATITSLLAILSLFAMLGSQTYILRTIPQRLEQFGSRNALRVFLKISTLIAISAITVMVLTKIGITFKRDFFSTIYDFQYLFYGLVFFTCLKILSKQALRSLGDYKVFSAFEILPPFLMMVVVAISIALSIYGDGFIYLYYTPHFFLALIAIYIVLRKFLNQAESEKTTDLRAETSHGYSSDLPTFISILSISIPMLGVNLSHAVITHTDILMLGAFIDAQTVGVYSVYVKFVALITMANTAVNSMYGPKASRLFAAGKMEELKTLTKRSTLITFSFSCLTLVAILTIHKPLLNMYGPLFASHLPAFYVLLVAVLFSSFAGSVGMLLNMTGGQKVLFVIIFTAAIANVVLNYYLIPLFGPTGAAYATLATVMYWNLVATIAVKLSLGFTAFPGIRNR